jgi:hypothetical protein
MSQMQSTLSGNTAPVVGRMGVQQSLAVPGLVTPPPVDPTVALVEETLRALEGGTAFFQQYTQFELDAMREQERQRREIQIEQERADRDAEVADRGLASRAARTALPDIQARIAREEIAPREGLTVRDQIESIVATQIEGQSPAYAEQFRDIAEPALAGAFAAQEGRIRDRVDRENLVFVGESLATQTDPARARATFESERAKFPTVTDTEYLASTAGSAMLIHAQAGNREGVAAMQAIIGNRLPEERAKANAELVQAGIRQEAKAADDYRQGVANLYVQGAPFDVIEEQIRRGEGTQDPTLIKQQLDELASRRERSVTESRRAAIAAFDAAKTDEAVRGAVVNSRSAMYTGGLAFVQDQTVERFDGTTLTIPAKVIRDTAIEQSMSQIAAENAPRDTSPQEAAASQRRTLVQQAQYLGENGQTYAPWTQMMNAGKLAGLSSFRTTAGKDGKGEVQIPANLNDGFDLYKRLTSVNPRLAAAHVDSETRMFYDLIDLAETYATPGQRPAAMMLAMRAVNGGLTEDTFSSGIDIKNVRDAFDEGDFASVNNRGELEQSVSRVARFYRATGAVGDPDTAIARAYEKVTSTLTSDGAYAIDLGPIAVPENYDVIARSVVEDYAAKFGEEEGIEADDLSLAPGETPGALVIYNRATGQPVENWANSGVYTIADIQAFAQGKADENTRNIVRKIIQAGGGKKMVEWPTTPAERLEPNGGGWLRRNLQSVIVTGSTQ